MRKNRVLQISLVMVAIILFFYTYYKSDDKDKIVDIDKKTLIDDNKLTDETSNIIENAKYTGESAGNFFELTAKIAKIKHDQPNINELQDVTVVITLRDLRKIIIQSDKAVFNKDTTDAEFFGNILVTEQDNIITCDNLDLFMSKNLITAYNSVKYKNSKNSYVWADKIDIDMITKEANIFMFDKKKGKVKVKYIN